MNQGRNILIIITIDGWCYLYTLGDTSIESLVPTYIGLEQVQSLIGLFHITGLCFHFTTIQYDLFKFRKIYNNVIGRSYFYKMSKSISESNFNVIFYEKQQ